MSASVHDALVTDLGAALAALDRLASDHRKCLNCHCYREVAEEALGLMDALRELARTAGPTPAAAGLPGGDEGAWLALRRRLSETEASHG